MFPFQGEHYQEIREEGIAFIEKEKENMAGVYICGIFDESEIVNDSILAKRSSKFHNYYKKKTSKGKKSEHKKKDEACQWKQKEKDCPKEEDTKEQTTKSETTKDETTKKENSKAEILHQQVIKEKTEDKEKSKNDGQSLADILKNRTQQSGTGSKKGKSNNTTDFQSTYNFENRKMVYEMLSKALQKDSEYQLPKPETLKFNDLNGLLSTRPPAILLSSDGEFFKVLEGAWFGVQGFQAGYPFEVSKHQMVIHIDFKRWILLLRLFLKESHALKSSVSSEYFLNWVKSHQADSLEDLARKIGVSEDTGEAVSLGKRENADFDGRKIISRSLEWAHILMPNSEVDSKIYSLENAGGIISFIWGHSIV